MSDIHQLYSQAEKLKDEGKQEEAVAVLESVLKLDPNHVLSHLTLGRVLTQLGRHEAAIEHSQKACEIEPHDAFNFTALSVTLQKAFAGTGERRYIQLAEDAMAQARSMH